MDQRTTVSADFSHYFNLGQMLDIQIDDISKERFQTYLVGLKEGSYLLVEQPSVAKYGVLREKLLSRQELIIRSIDERLTGEIMGFRSTINYKLEKPDRLLVISYPGKIEVTGLRKESRIVVHTPCKITDSARNELEANIVDFSSGGCQLEIHEENPSLKQGDVVEVVFTHPVGGEENNQTCEIRAVRKKRKLISYGVSFDQT